MELKELIKQAVEEKIAGTETFLVDVKAPYSKIVVYVDNPAGMKLEECAEISKHLESVPALQSIFETHELEVSSPGMDEPLKVMKQYEKRIGQEITVLLKDGSRKNGTLKSAGENGFVIVEKKNVKENGKKSLEIIEQSILLEDVKETKVLFNFHKILR
jgi:ribosome maturation factor RimP